MLLFSACESRTLAQETRPAHLSIRHYGICLQGFLVGLCLEGALALCLYGLYRVAYASRRPVSYLNDRRSNGSLSDVGDPENVRLKLTGVEASRYVHSFREKCLSLPCNFRCNHGPVDAGGLVFAEADGLPSAFSERRPRNRQLIGRSVRHNQPIALPNRPETNHRYQRWGKAPAARAWALPR